MYNEQAARYRDRAQDMRRLAERAHNERLRYLSMAEDWERLADDTERATTLTRDLEPH